MSLRRRKHAAPASPSIAASSAPHHGEVAPSPAEAAWVRRVGGPRRAHLIIIGIVLLLALPAFIQGWNLRREVYRTNSQRPLSADASGFIAAAKTGLHWFYGWREPLMPQAVWLTARATDGDLERGLSALVLAMSLLALPLGFAFAWRLAGPLAALVALYMLAASQLHLQMVWFRERSDLYLVLLIVFWWSLHEGWWWAAAVAVALATWLRSSTLASAILTLALWIAFVKIDWRGLRGGQLAAATREWRTAAFHRRHGAKWAAVALALALCAPLFLHYKIRFGSFSYAQKIVFYDYYLHATQGKWLVDVTGGFNRKYDIPAGFSPLDLFQSPGDFARKVFFSARRTLLPPLGADPSRFVTMPHPAFTLFYYLGLTVGMLRRPGRAALAFLLGYTLPFLVVAWLPELHGRFFVPTLYLAYIISGIGLTELAALASRASHLSSQ